jgi:hypothetical protein
MGFGVVRAGWLAVFEGVEYIASNGGGEIYLLLPRNLPCPDGWVYDKFSKCWMRSVPRDDVTSLSEIFTSANLGDRRVRVEKVDVIDRTALVDGGTTGRQRGQSPPVPPHPLLDIRDQDASALYWAGYVSWDDLTDVREEVTLVFDHS